MPSLSAERNEVLRFLTERTAGLDEVAEQTRLPTPSAKRMIGELLAMGLIEVAEEPSGPSGQAPVYQAHLNRMGEEWKQLPKDERERISARIGEVIDREVRQSFRAGVFDERTDRFLTRVGVQVDEEGWQELVEIQEQALNQTIETVARSIERLEASGEKPIEGRTYQVLFEMPDPPSTESS